MRDPEVPSKPEPTIEEKARWAYDDRRRHLERSNARASVVRSQITEAYHILENIRFECVGDTAFRERIYLAKKILEQALDDFLMDSSYWKSKLDAHRRITPEQFYGGGKDESRAGVPSESVEKEQN